MPRHWRMKRMMYTSELSSSGEWSIRRSWLENKKETRFMSKNRRRRILYARTKKKKCGVFHTHTHQLTQAVLSQQQQQHSKVYTFRVKRASQVQPQKWQLSHLTAAHRDSSSSYSFSCECKLIFLSVPFWRLCTAPHRMWRGRLPSLSLSHSPISSKLSAPTALKTQKNLRSVVRLFFVCFRSREQNNAGNKAPTYSLLLSFNGLVTHVSDTLGFHSSH